MSWLTMHLEEFVKPVLGDDFSDEPLGYFTLEEMTVIKNVWRSMKKKAGRKQIFLPGRDVFIFEILARREGYPTVFMPECSRQTVEVMAKELGPVARDCHLFDTGFLGSIPMALRSKRFNMMSYTTRESTVQVFPRLTFSRGLALKIEKTPKYWSSGRLDAENNVVQDQSDIFEFARAARLTIEVYKNSSPKFIKKNKPISTRGF
jgi:hypothetical protein